MVEIVSPYGNYATAEFARYISSAVDGLGIDYNNRRGNKSARQNSKQGFYLLGRIQGGNYYARIFDEIIHAAISLKISNVSFAHISQAHFRARDKPLSLISCLNWGSSRTRRTFSKICRFIKGAQLRRAGTGKSYMNHNVATISSFGKIKSPKAF
jgi:hypothetical protein